MRSSHFTKNCFHRLAPERRSLSILLVAAFALLIAPPEGSAAEFGRFVFVDLLTDKPGKSRGFYGRMFGWRFRPQPDRPSESIIYSGGQEMGFLVEVDNRELEVSESQWVPVLAVPSADAAERVARAEGGAVEVPTQTDGTDGRFAVLRDRQGALFSAYSGKIGSVTTGQTGQWAWVDLFTTNTASASRFYRKIAGFKTVRMKGRGPDRFFVSDSVPRAGLIPIKGKSIESAWVPYVFVADLEKAIGRAERLGGKLVARDQEAAIIIDPAGAAIGLHAESGRP